MSVDVKTVGLKGGKKFRTIVKFDDGFEYISHRGTEREDKFVFYEISLPESAKHEIINDAIAYHHRLIVKNTDCENNTPREYLRTCKRCGYLIDSNSLSCPHCGNNTIPYYCGKCGTPGPYEQLCPKCGSSIKKYN